MSFEGIRNFIKNVIPQIAAMDGDTAKLGDSAREVSIMNRLLANASPEEKDLVQKYLDGEPIANPHEKNNEATVSYDMDGADIFTSNFLREATRYEVKYDKAGNASDEDIFYDEDDNVVAKSVYSTDKDGNTVVETKKESGAVQKKILDKDGLLVENIVEERTEEDGTKLKDVIMMTLNDGTEFRIEQYAEDSISVMIMDSDGSGIGQAYKVENGVVKIPKTAQRVDDEDVPEDYRKAMSQLVNELKPQFEEMLLKHYNFRLEVEE